MRYELFETHYTRNKVAKAQNRFFIQISSQIHVIKTVTDCLNRTVITIIHHPSCLFDFWLFDISVYANFLNNNKNNSIELLKELIEK